MKKYEKPEIVIEAIFRDDIFTESSGDTDFGGGDIFLPPDEF